MPPEPTDSAGPLPAAAVSAMPAPRPRRRRRWPRRVLLIGGPLIVAAAAGILYLGGGRTVSTENAYVKADMMTVSAEVSGRIVAVAVDDNQRVAAGDVLFRLDDRPFRLSVNRAEARLEAVREEIEGLEAEYRQKAEELKLVETDRAYTEREFQRHSKLATRRVVSEVKLDEIRHAMARARQRIAVTRQEMAQIRARLGGAPERPIRSQARYREAMAAVDQARLDLENTVVRAAFAGVASHVPETGEHVVARTPVMSVVAVGDVWVEANFKETDLTHVVPGQAVSLRVDAYPDRVWRGSVESIAQATGAEFAVIPPQNATGNWVKVVQRIPVRIDVDAVDGGPILRTGMSAEVEIDIGRRRTLPGIFDPVAGWLGATAPALAAATHGPTDAIRE